MEVTEEMIGEGVDALANYQDEDSRRLAVAIYEAMSLVAPAPMDSNGSDEMERVECLRIASSLLISSGSHEAVIKAATAFYEFCRGKSD